MLEMNKRKELSLLNHTQPMRELVSFGDIEKV